MCYCRKNKAFLSVLLFHIKNILGHSYIGASVRCVFPQLKSLIIPFLRDCAGQTRLNKGSAKRVYRALS